MTDPGELAKRLHGGPLQAFYAAALALEAANPDIERATGILRTAALDLADVIDELDRAADSDASGAD